jgi:hypothetical protein
LKKHFNLGCLLLTANGDFKEQADEVEVSSHVEVEEEPDMI